MKKFVIFLASLTLLTSYAQTATSTSTNRTRFDRAFLSRATADALQEVALGELAQTRAQNTELQALGQQLVATRTAAIEQAQQLASSLGIALPTSLNPTQQQRVQRLSALSGAAFDRALLSSLLQLNFQDTRLFKSAAVLATHANVRAFTRNQLPVLVQQMVNALQLREILLATQLASTTSASTPTAPLTTSTANATANAARSVGTLANPTGTLANPNGTLNTAVGTLATTTPPVGTLTTSSSPVGTLATSTTPAGTLANPNGALATSVGSLANPNGILSTSLGSLANPNGILSTSIGTLGTTTGTSAAAAPGTLR